MAEKKVTDRIDVDQFAKMFKLPSWESVQEQNVDYISESSGYARREGRQEDMSEEEIEAASQKAEEEASEEVYRNWHGAVTSAADELFGHHKLVLVPLRKKKTPYPFEFRIEPAHGATWGDAAKALAATIDGVGLTYEDPNEYARAPKNYVLSRLGWIGAYPEVYGTSNPSRIYERSWR